MTMVGCDKQRFDEFNVLITSISKKVPLIKAVKRAHAAIGITGKVFGADSSEGCIGRYFVDIFWRMPELVSLDVQDLIDYCYSNCITCIIPTRDRELEFFAWHKKKLHANGISVMVSDIDIVEKCIDKLLFFQYGNSTGFPVIPTFSEITKLDYPLYVVKERYGAGALSLGLQLDSGQAKLHARHMEHPIFQPYISGREFSIDVYVDIKGQTKGIITRTRDMVVNGESQVTTAVREKGLEQLCSDFAERLGIYGHAVFQALVDEEKNYYIVECNSRFGGASTLSIAAGLDSFYWFFLESTGYDLGGYPFLRNPHELKQIRYAEDKIIDNGYCIRP